MKINFIYVFMLFLSITEFAHAQILNESSKIIVFDDYIKTIVNALPELKSNAMDVQSAENKIQSAKSGSDIYLDAGGKSFSKKEYSGINDKGDMNGYNYYAGLSKTFSATGTTVSGSYNYTKNNYSNFSSTSDYSSYEPSMSIKISQPLLYNFLGKVDKYSENDAKMQFEIAKYKLEENNKSVLNAYKKIYFQWILYNKNIKNLNDAIKNSNILKEQIRRKVDAGLADNDDYQGATTSVLTYENLRIENSTILKNIENQLSLYLDTKIVNPDSSAFDNYYIKASGNEHQLPAFKETTSSKIMELTMKNYLYSKDVYDNKLLPQFNIFTEVTKKNLTETQTYNVNDTDYNVGFEFKYYLENNSAESALREIEIQIKALEYEYKSTENNYKKSILICMETMRGITEQLSKKEKTLKALESQLLTEKRKYSQARLNLSYVINTENNITSEKNNILTLKYQLIGYYIDYLDLIR